MKLLSMDLACTDLIESVITSCYFNHNIMICTIFECATDMFRQLYTNFNKLECKLSSEFKLHTSKYVLVETQNVHQ